MSELEERLRELWRWLWNDPGPAQCCQLTAAKVRSACADEIAADCANRHLCSGDECISEQVRSGKWAR